MANFSTIGTWILRILAALILLQTLYFKFSASPESIYIFSKLGMEPWGRISIGILELIAGILILVPVTTPFGALLAIALMSGAIFFHLTKLGISVQNDGGQLFIYAVLVLVSSTVLVIIYRSELLTVKKILTRS
ncbi:MAG: DoxX family membrane protein [Bacteroidetes bacterium]|nr:MAG: DoxX family membrane protein [Bacteroidota bacterium]